MFLALPAFIGTEAKNEQTHAETQRILQKVIGIVFVEGCTTSILTTNSD
jgi:hypothetical protein